MDFSHRNFKQMKHLPSFPRITHLSWKPNIVSGDLVSQNDNIIFSDNVIIEEKVDGASVGMALVNSHPLIRNRNHVLNKGYLKDTPAKMQFRPLWNWFYENKELFKNLNDVYSQPVSVYGEWMYAQHGMKYDKLPSYFIAYELFFPEENRWTSIDPELGFITTKRLGTKIDSYEMLENLTNELSEFSSELREGVVVKIKSGNNIIERFKMVRQGFVQGALWSNTIKRNLLND